jgi:hypothetical protein
LNKLSVFGLCAVISMVVCYSLEDRARGYTLAFAVACLLGSAYGFLQGAWPFGAVEIVWAGIAVKKWWGRAREQESS